MRELLYTGFILFAFAASSQVQYAEATLGVGYTAIDIEGLVEKDEIAGTSAEDWEQLSGGLSLQYMRGLNEQIGIGGEFMYQYLYWYSVEVPFGSQPIYREYSVDAWKLGPIIRFGLDSPVSLDIGPQLNFLDNAVFGGMASVNFNFPLNEHFTVPLKLRIDFIDNIVVTVPITLNVGVKYQFQ